MIKSDAQHLASKRHRLDHKKKQFTTAAYAEQKYLHRLSVYDVPPTAEITLEEFEEWAIDRLRSMPKAMFCSCSADPRVSPCRDRSMFLS